jgi:hypothetical protein
MIFYNKRGVTVTDKYVETAEGRFAVREMQTIRRVETYSYPARRVALICGTIELGLAAALVAHYGAFVLIFGGVVGALVLGFAILIDGRRNPRWMALRCTYAGAEITLFKSRDQRIFEAMCRAVIRAVEATRLLGVQSRLHTERLHTERQRTERPANSAGRRTTAY